MKIDPVTKRFGIQPESLFIGETASYTGVLNKTLTMLALVVLGGLISGFMSLFIPAMGLIALLLAILNIYLAYKIFSNDRKGKVNPGLNLTFAFLEGFSIGPISMIYEAKYSGIVLQAVFATIIVALVSALAYKFNIIRATGKFRKMFFIGIVALILTRIVGLVLALITGYNIDGNGIGVAISIIAVGLASMSFVIDLDDTYQFVESGAPAEKEWVLSTGIVVTLVWMYLEILRLLGRRN